MVALPRVLVPTAEHMLKLGAAFGRLARAGDAFWLEGDLGAGKTTFVQGLAQGLEVSGEVTSPSFVIENQYAGSLTLYHVDLYRLDHVGIALAEELEEHIFGDGVAAVEWPDRLPADWPRDGCALHFEVLGDGTREVTAQGCPDRLAAAFAELSL